MVKKQSISKTIAQKCSKALGLRKSCASGRIEPSKAPLIKLTPCTLAEHDVELNKVKVCRSNSTSTPTSTRSGVSSRSCSKQSLPGSVESDDEDEEMSPFSPAISRMSSKEVPPQQAELRRIAKLLGQKAVFNYREIRNAFLAVDANGDGRVTASEVASFCAHFAMSPEVASRLFSLMDKDDNGDANWQKFMSVFAPVFKEVKSTAEPPCYATWRLCPSVNQALRQGLL